MALSDRSGVGYKYIGQVELGKADPGADTLVRLARGLSVPVGELFETITPSDPSAPRVSNAEAEVLTSSLAALAASVDRVLGRQRPSALAAPTRAPRRLTR